MLDENGEPLVVYHATSADFNVFDRDELGLETYDNASDLFYGMTASVGHSFNTQNLYETRDYGNRAIAAFLNIREPNRFYSIGDVANDIKWSGVVPEDKTSIYDFDDTMEINELGNPILNKCKKMKAMTA